MSNTHAPRSAAPRRPDTRRRQVRGRVPGAKRTRPEPPAPETWAQRFRHYAPAAVLPLAVLALAVVAVCFGTILIGGWRLAYLPAAIGQTWLTLNAAPLRIDGVDLGAVPLLPAVGIVALVASRIRAATRRRVSVLDLAAILGLIVLTSLTLSGIALFMVSDASNVFAVAPPHPAAALLAPLGLHLAGFIFGIRPVVWRALARRVAVPPVVVESAHAAWQLVRDLLWAALAVYVLFLVLGQARVSEIGAAYPPLHWSGLLALAALTIAYLPNAAVATLSVLLGGSVDYAGASLSLFDATAVALPPLPIFAAVPPAVPAWAPALMLVPAAIAVRFVLTRDFTLISVAATATWAAIIGIILGLYASGTAGAYGVIGPDLWTLALLLFAWAGVCGLAAWLVALVRGRGEGAAAETGESGGED
ncbi:DUF6350 family protein [Corynebacterium sp. TA-R-1]|uniref:DUF6350 family protein n=1 Tax=Corynebacterium stercoris TaxID=2943490 RepID=A0ABT1G2Z9_9CORY|nr:DUF6350 family protein [Corynebacterium stercoris]MCP1388346.1 DUF6350 family protein [Corynebacterium stercoris]